MASLYEIDRRIEEILDRLYSQVDDSTGEVPESISEAILVELDALNEERAEKLDNIGAYIKSLTAEASAIKAEIDSLKDRLDKKQKKIESLSKYVKFNLILHNEKKFETARVAFSFRKSEKVAISDESILPKKYLKKEVTYKPDKTAIKEALKNGQKVRGAVLEENQNLQIK